MTPELLMLRGLVASLPEKERHSVEAHATVLRGMVADCGETFKISLMLVAVEVGAEQ